MTETTGTSVSGNLAAINHVVVLMLENRSFDHMLGYLYSAQGNVSPLTGQPFEGLTGTEQNPDGNGGTVGRLPDHPVHPERLLHARRRPRRGLQGDQRPALRDPPPPPPPAPRPR